MCNVTDGFNAVISYFFEPLRLKLTMNGQIAYRLQRKPSIFVLGVSKMGPKLNLRLNNKNPRLLSNTRPRAH
jgi:hypothetical protein